MCGKALPFRLQIGFVLRLRLHRSFEAQPLTFHCSAGRKGRACPHIRRHSRKDEAFSMMNDQHNSPGIERPPATSDLIPLPDTDAITPVTTIGKFKIPTDVLRAYTMVFALVAIWIYFNFSTGHIFLESRNFSNLMRQTSVTGVLAVGMLMVIVTAQIDLSI